MQKKFFQTADAEVSLSDSGCRSFSIRQQTQDTLFETEDAGVSIRQRMHDIFNQTADARLFLSRGGCMSHSIRQQMQKSLYQTADTGLYLKKQWMQDSLHQTANPGVTVYISDSSCKKTNNGCRFLCCE